MPPKSDLESGWHRDGYMNLLPDKRPLDIAPPGRHISYNNYFRTLMCPQNQYKRIMNKR